MSWSQRPGSAAPPERPPFPHPHQAPPTQPYGNQQNMYPNYQGGTPAGSTQQYWQNPQQPQYNQQYGQTYQQQDYQHNANQFYQQPQQFNQNYANQGFTNTQPQQGYEQNYYQNQTSQQNYSQTKPKTDGWEDNWDWGWDESSKQAKNAASQNHSTAPPVQMAPQQQVFNNANVIEESFASTDTWNWSMEDKKEPKAPTPAPKQEPATLPERAPVQNNAVNELPPRSASNQSTQQSAEDVKTLSDRDVVKERMPNLALGKRFHLENLTPQWSIESQMSQESSDGPQTHSEGTYRSDNQSRNSSKSSPGPNTDNSNFNYSQTGLDEYPPSSEWSKHNNDESTLAENVQNSSRRESHDELASSMQDMSIANREKPVPDLQAKPNLEPENRNVQEGFNSHRPLSSVSPANFPPPVSSMLPQPPPLSASMPQASSASVPNLPPPPSSSANLPPPTNFPPTSSTNPFKQSGPFSHKKAASASPSLQSFPPPISSTNLTSPSAVNKITQHRAPVGFGANLETTPDNSERPDQPAMTAFRPMPVAQQIPDNLEVAPQNDRNEYLQTAHLSSGDYGENTDFSRTAPPLGLRRMVVGQQETEYSQNLNISGDEPPPGLARMVPGQQTETDNSYNQPSDNYMDRHIDGQPTDGSGRPYRQADGQQTPDNYTQPQSNRGSERRPIGLDRMVPGEPSNDEYSQYQSPNYAGSNEQRVVMGFDHDYPVPADAGPSDIREQNVDGSDYSEQTPRNPSRNVIGARESSNNVSPDFNAAPEDQQREVTMEGENLQDLSAISSAELQFSREQTLEGADLNSTDVTAVKADASDSNERPATGSRRQSLNRVNTSGEESERDRAFKSSPRRDRDKHKSSRDRDRDRVRDKEGRYSSRGDRKYDREDRRTGDRRSEKDRRDRERDRKERDESPDMRRHKRSTRSHRYETEDTDYYSDRERERRRYREGSYASKPPRPDDKERRYEERDRSRRYNTIERDRRYEDDRDAPSRRRDRRDRYGQYRDIDPTRTYGNIRRDEEERRRGQAHSSGSRPGSREALATDDDLNDSLVTSEARSQRYRDRDRDRDARRPRHNRQDPYYDGYGTAGYTDPYVLQRQQYQYYEHLRLTDPAAYMQVYKQVMAGHAPPPPPPEYRTKYLAEGYSSLGYESRTEERNSVHSGRSSANGLKGNDTYYVGSMVGYGGGAGSLRDAPSLRTDLSDRDLNTDASLNLGNLDTSTVRSERMTPCKFSTAHIKGNIGSRHVVVVRPSYPVDGLPATVQILSLSGALAHEQMSIELEHYPGPLVKGVTHKKSVMEYCLARVRGAGREGAVGRDVIGYVLLWELLALLLRQNGVVVGTDIAELLMKNKQEYDYNASLKSSPQNDSRGGSSHSGREEEPGSPDPPSASTTDLTPQDELSSQTQTQGDEKASLDRLREYLTYGNRQEALEWAMSNNQWGFAMTLAAYCERRTRASVAARFLASIPRHDPLHTLIAHLQAKQPPAATCVSDERWGDWRPHVAIMLSNNSAKPDQDRRTLTQLGDSLSSRGLLYSAQFCYISAGLQVSRHPLAPLQPPAEGPQTCPRLALLLADPRAASLHQLATNRAIFATEIYEYALSLNQDYVINDLQVYKLILATRLIDAGAYERALAYVEQAARAVTRSPRDYSPALVAQLAELADRLKYHDPALQEDPPLLEEGHSSEGSPRHHQQWLDDVKSVALLLTSESQQNTPQHQQYPPPAPAPASMPPPPPNHTLGNQYSWSEQPQQPQPAYAEPEETADYSQYYQQQQPPQADQPQQQQYSYEDWQRTEEQHHQGHADPYWQGDNQYGYGEAGAGAGAGDERPAITMPGATPSRPSLYNDYDDDRPPSGDGQTDRETDTPKPAKKQEKPKDASSAAETKGKGGGWLGGILTKLSLRPPNQMILPDDKNPTIVWDAEHKRWRNTDGDEDEVAGAPPPPPTLRDLQLHPNMAASSPSQPPAPAQGAPPSAPVSNIFKMQKGRHIKKSYVDVFNPSGAATRPLPPPSEVLGPAPAPLASPAYFVPAPTNNDQVIDVSESSTPRDSPHSIPTPTPFESGIYDTSQLNDDNQYRQSGI